MSKFMGMLNERVEQLIGVMGTHGPLPPRIADFVEMVRESKAAILSEHMNNRNRHMGWTPIPNTPTLPGYGPAVISSLKYDLSNAYDVPLSILMAMDITIDDDPSKMRWIATGMLPPVWQDRSTPELVRIAYEGVKMGWWSEKDIDIPEHMIALEDSAQDVDGLSVWVAGEISSTGEWSEQYE